MERTINFSFIIPHKNTPDLLQKCLDSIPRRDDVQIIVVDDNSDEEIVDFSRFPCLDDPIVEIFLTKEEKGAGYARNVGLMHAVGKWLIFADADDFFNPCIASFLDTHLNSSSDIVFWRVNSIDLDTGKPGYRGRLINEFNSEAIETGNFANILLISNLYKGMYSSKMIFDNKIIFNESRWGNDVVFSSKVAVSVTNAEAYNDVVYCITQHSKFGLISNPSTESRRTRFLQEIQSIRITRKKFKRNRNIHTWFFQTWFDLYKDHLEGLKLLPKAIYADNVYFIIECIKAKFS